MDANSDQPFAQLGYDLMAAAFEVYNELGGGFSEEIYQECLERELAARRIAFTAQPGLAVFYKGVALNKHLRPDLIVGGEIVVELKAVKTLAEEHEAQLLNYLRIIRKPLGYLINFAAFPKLQWKRFANTRNPSF
ncbi:MAG: GxxExxY protein [Verrucomicrobia bacterium]|nr:GxxExxY protein [Verrucomicrobiota bacterium]